MGDKIRKILALDGKTQCGSGNAVQKANHIVSAVDESGFCVGEVLVDGKSNEITAIPELLNSFNVKGQIVTLIISGNCEAWLKLKCIEGACNYFITTDKPLLKYRDSGIVICNPTLSTTKKWRHLYRAPPASSYTLFSALSIKCIITTMRAF